jgi:uncharacterized membrane protein
MVNNVMERTMLEARIAALEERTSALEARMWADPPPAPRPRPDSQAAAAAGATAAAAPRRDLEDVFGGSGLAWLGGIAVVAGLAFLLTIAVSRGWIGEGARTALAGALSLGLLAAGAWLRERRGRNAAALAAAAAGVAGAFGTLLVAGQVYSLVPDAVGLLGALAVGAGATALAVRWRAPVMGWIGLCGALLAPEVLAGGALAYLAVAYAATVAVLVWQRWSALGIVASAIAALQWTDWLVEDPRGIPAVAAVVALFGALGVAAAIGFELRRREPRVRGSAVALLILNAVAVDAAGWWALHDVSLIAADGLLVAVAAAHLGVGLAGARLPRVSRELALTALGIGIVLADVALAALTSGLPLVLGWVAGAVGFGWLLQRRLAAPAGDPDARADRAFALAGLGGHLLSALAHALVIDAPLSAGSPGAAGILAVGAIAAGAGVSARLADHRLRVVLDTLALALVAYVSVRALDGVALAAAFAAQAAGLAALARRERNPLAGYAGAAFAGLALTDALVLAPPTALLDGLGHPLAAAGALAAAAGAAGLASRPLLHPLRSVLQAVAAGAAVYLASVELVSAVQPALTAQTLLSVLWAVVGVGTLVAGLVTDRRELRRAGLVMLGLTATKVFFYDLSALTSLARVGSLIGLGVLLLAGGFAWQRVRPLPVPDLREAEAH